MLKSSGDWNAFSSENLFDITSIFSPKILQAIDPVKSNSLTHLAVDSVIHHRICVVHLSQVNIQIASPLSLRPSPQEVELDTGDVVLTQLKALGFCPDIHLLH